MGSTHPNPTTVTKTRQLGNVQIAPEVPLSDLYLVPQKCTKVVHFVRHGEGFHNVAGAISEENYKSYEYFDAHLTETGWKQTKALKRHLKQQKIEVDLVVVSPMSRALETAVGVFGGDDWVSNGHPPLMVEQYAMTGKSSARAPVAMNGAPPFLALEMIREQLGCHPCDKRRTKSHLMEEFPGVDFSLIEFEDDVYYEDDVREAADQIQARGVRLMQFLLNRPEKRIAVVSHAGFLRNCLRQFGLDFDERIKEGMHGSLNNCEMRTMVLACQGSQALDHPGYTSYNVDFSGKVYDL
eukprot:TRINITY_DN4159_c0_g1_i1.p1 TRINITY_DN4159_c0_g1~~TRINITY_DN4159_c0_g1_i1.p1  ORF type:complete len:296 (+),score=36.99 TRINITY_DN4159_c0_g1_i1:90-977(+)